MTRELFGSQIVLHPCRRASMLSRVAGVILCFVGSLPAQTAATTQGPVTDRARALLDRIEVLEKRVAALEAKTNTLSRVPSSTAPIGAADTQNPAPAATNVQSEEAVKRGILGLPGTTLNFYLDGYYGWNFNQPLGRVNLLRANDVLSNNFTLNQFSLILERAPDIAAGRR